MIYKDLIMFGLFKKTEDYHSYINTGIHMVDSVYKAGIRAGNDQLLEQYKDQVCEVYLKVKPLYEEVNKYLVARPYDRSLTNSAQREKIVHCLMLLNAFGFGLSSNQLDEKHLRKIVERDSELIFKNTNSFSAETKAFHRKVYEILREIYLDFNPPIFPSMSEMMR